MPYKVFLFSILFLLLFACQAQNVGIGTSTPTSSALLELRDSTRGLLPPRMNQAQRDLLTPAEGLVIYNTTTKKPNFYNGVEWRNYDGTTAISLSIGMSYQGGMLFYFLRSGDNGYDPDKTHGLISSLSDQSTSIQWYNGSYIVTGASATRTGFGKVNTANIISSQGPGIYAAKICADLSLGGYTDWYLPNHDETRPAF